MRTVSTLPPLIAGTALLAAHTCALGEPANPEESTPSFRGSLQTWGYYNGQTAVRDSSLNPDNRILRIAPEQFVADARLNMSMSWDAVDIVCQPRWFGESQENGSGARNRSDASVRQAFGRLAFGKGGTLTAGREVMAWGPANFRSPSSPFYFDSGKLNQLREVAGIDLARVDKVAGPYSISLGYVFDTSERTGVEAADSGFLKFDYQGTAFLLSANIAGQRHAEPFLGAYAQGNVGDALLLYAEYGYGRRANALRIDATQQPPFIPYTPDESASYLGGASYTLLNGQSVSLEYLRDRHGYSPADQDTYFEVLAGYADRAANAPDPALRERSYSVLGLAAANAPGLLGRDYVSLLWQSNLQDTAQYWRVAAVGNTHDRSGQFSGYYERNLTPHFSLFLNGVRNVGPAASEFGLSIEYVWSIGVKAFIF